MTEARKCRCGCGTSLDGLRADAVWASEACKKRAERAASRDKAGTGHPLQTVREQQAAKKHNRDLGGLIRKAIIDQIKTTGECFADDLVDLYPEGEVKECRRLATAQFGSMVASGLIREKERRKSKFATRKGGKSGVYIFTQKGREEFVGVGGELEGADVVPAPGASRTPHSDETPGADDSLGVLTGGPPSAPDSSDQPLVGVTAGPNPQGEGHLEDGDEAAGSHSGKSSAAVSRQPQGEAPASQPPSVAAAEPPCLPGFEETSLDRMADAA